jgi:hypothetical protein
MKANGFKNNFWPMPLFIFFNLQTMHIKQLYICKQLHCYVFHKNPYTLAGFEPGPSVLEANVMSIAPRRQGQYVKVPFTNWQWKPD